MKFICFGSGKMAKSIARIANIRGHETVSSLKEADVCIDFSVATAVLEHVKKACKEKVPIVIGTTGWEQDIPTAQKIVQESKNAALYAPNFSIGVAQFRKLLIEARRLFPNYEIAGLEMHHKEKKDAPSGTAKILAKDLGLSSFSTIRLGSIIGQHEVLFDSPSETISIKHEAKNRDGFALGAIQAAEWIHNQIGWLTLDDMLYCTHYTF
ncbi:MAG: dihydrodipicolinate reductase C-terminal domain-containing protein [Chlamydiales bacterium]